MEPESIGRCDEDPRRESAKERLERLIVQKRRQLVGLEHLLKIADKIEDGSPGEETLWEILISARNLRG